MARGISRNTCIFRSCCAKVLVIREDIMFDWATSVHVEMC